MAPAFQHARELVRGAVAQWEAVSRIRLTGWAACSEDRPSDIRITHAQLTNAWSMFATMARADPSSASMGINLTCEYPPPLCPPGGGGGPNAWCQKEQTFLIDADECIQRRSAPSARGACNATPPVRRTPGSGSVSTKDMASMRFLGGMLLCGLVGLVGSARADQTGVVGGRLLLRAGNNEISLVAARAALNGEALVLELRRGTQVLEASLDDDGYFWVKAPAGTYRLEYLRVGTRAEFFAPQELVIEPGALTCAGTIALELDRVEALGANVSNRVAVTDQCAETAPRLRAAAGPGVQRIAIARPGPQYEHYSGVTWRDLAIGLRAEVAIGEHRILRGLFRLPPLAREGLFSRWIFLVGGGGLRGDRDQIAYDVTLGAGVHVSYFDLLAIGGARWPDGGGVEAGPVAGGVIRMHSVIWGLGLRVEALPSRAAFLTIDLAPLGLLGSLL